jgi:hypothetical protein
MVSLIDIVPQKQTVQIAGGEIELRGLGLRQIADLLVRFPEVRKLLVEGAPAIDIDTLLAGAPEAVGTIIAQSAGQPEAADTIADALSLDDLADCLIAIRDLTMPNGLAPFMDRIARLVSGASGVPLGKGPDMNTPPRPNGSSPQGIALPT